MSTSHLRLALVMLPEEGLPTVRVFEGRPRVVLQRAQDAAKAAGAAHPTANVQILVVGSSQARMVDIIERARRVRQTNAAYLARATMRLVSATVGESLERASTLGGLGAALAGRAHPAM